MAKAKRKFVCQQCGGASPRWQGQCDDCGGWNTLAEEAAETVFSARHDLQRGGRALALTALDADVALPERERTGISEFDRALGGGLVAGSATLIGGDPGIGKSTLLLQAAAEMARRGLSDAYIGGEAASDQVRLRARRLGLGDAPVQLASATSVRDILTTLGGAAAPDFLVIDSIQTMHSDLIDSAPGTVSQVRASAQELIRFAKDQGTALVLVGHVTKDGSIAGPRVLEHMVDAVLYFEGESGSRFRVLRAFKNRFGAVNELGVFAMSDKGLREVPNPSAIFLSSHSGPTSGSAVMVTREGTRPLLVEVQALVDQSSLGNPRRVTLGLEQNRLAMLLAVLHRHGGVAAYDQDVFVNVVGGIRVQETAADLPVLLAVLSSLRDRPLPEHMITFGEVGLSGEIRPVPNGEERLKEAAHHGFRRAIVPKANAPKKGRVGDMEVTGVERLSEAIDACR